MNPIKVLFCLTFLAVPLFAAEQTLLLRQPSISEHHLAFAYAGDIWICDRSGKNPRRLTTHIATEGGPKLSPDGRWVAFTANYDNNVDVYLISVDGGQPKRITWHSAGDTANGWTPDGKKIVFTSRREMGTGRSSQVYTVSSNGGYPDKMMEAIVAEGAWSPNGKRFAYRPHRASFAGRSGWRQYRGGTATPIWIINPKSQKVEKVPNDGVNDMNPMWLGKKLYLISDRNDGACNLFAYDKGQLTQLTKETVWDVRNADAHGDTIVYEVGGHLKSLNVASGEIEEIVVSIKPDLPQLRPSWKNAVPNIQAGVLSPTGKRALITARGDVFTVPIKNGTTRNLTHSDGVREMGALWSPKGDKIAYITDKGSVHRLAIVNQNGGDPTIYELGDIAYYTLLNWGGDGKRIIYQDNHLNLYAILADSGERTLIAKDQRRGALNVAMSKDGRWLAYTTIGANHFSKIMVHDFENGKNTAITDGLSAADWPAFSPDGAYLYFTASTNSGPTSVFLDMSTQERPIRMGIYAVVLQADGKSPLLPKSDEEEVKKDKVEDADEAEGKDKDTSKDKDKKEEKKGGIDLDGIKTRIVALPIAERNYDSLAVGHDGALYYMERRQPGGTREPPGGQRGAGNNLYRFDFKDKKAVKVKATIGFSLSADGKSILLRGRGGATVAKVGKKLDAKALDMADVKIYVNPVREWAQIFDETWRMERDYFYDSAMHNLDWQGVYDRYKPLLAHVGRREDLNWLMVQMIAEMQVGHNSVGGGDVHRETPVNVGLLGADLRVEKGFYRVTKIYTGEKWNPFLKAPLAAVGIGVSEGNYIVSINGQPLSGNDNIYAYLQGTVGKQVTLGINTEAKSEGAKEVVVEPIGFDFPLRNWNWIEENRKYVEKKTNGKVGYVYLPDTAGGGFTFFNRMFFAQVDKQALIIDERRNGGGQAANYITDILSRKYLGSWKDRDGLVFDTPGGAIYGPKVMLIDQDAGSGGDFLPYSFRYMGLGTLIGTTTWGGLIGIQANPGLIDGGRVSVPYFRFYTPEGEWRIENEGVAPDLEVELEPADVNKGIDTQLERAITEVMAQLKDYKPVKLKEAPPMPSKPGQ